MFALLHWNKNPRNNWWRRCDVEGVRWDCANVLGHGCILICSLLPFFYIFRFFCSTVEWEKGEAITIEINYTQCQYCVTCKSRAFHAHFLSYTTCQPAKSLINTFSDSLLVLFLSRFVFNSFQFGYRSLIAGSDFNDNFKEKKKTLKTVFDLPLSVLINMMMMRREIFYMKHARNMQMAWNM